MYGKAPHISKFSNSTSSGSYLSFPVENLPQVGTTNQKLIAESCPKAETKRSYQQFRFKVRRERVPEIKYKE